VKHRAVSAIAAAVLFAAGAAAWGADLTFFGALSLAGGGDLNRALRGWDAYYRDINGKPHSLEYDFGEMKWFPGGGATLTIPLGKRFSLGLGGEFIRGTTSGFVSGSLRTSSSETLIEGERRDIETEETFKRTPDYEFKAVAASVLAFTEIPLGRGVRVYLGAGPGLYFGELLFRENFEERLRMTEVRTLGDASTTYLNHYSATGLERQNLRMTAFGVLVLAGLEVRVNGALGLVFEAGGRRAVCSDWDGNRFLLTSWTHAWGEDGRLTAGGEDESVTDGRLYAVEVPNADTGRGYDRLVVSAERPASTAWRNVRSATVDLTGVSFRLGVRLRI